jgi:CubicO group peptidase (beta-lactamase class C family)
MKHFLLCIFLSVVSIESKGQYSPDIATKLDTYLKSANNAYRFNGVALVLSKDEILLHKGYGFRDMEARSLNSPETRFPILSITKTFTATIILKLQEEGKLMINDKLTKYFPHYPNGSKITIHHLLTHSSGIYNYTVDVGIEDSAIVNHPIPKKTVVSHFKDKASEFRPGRNYSYNNSGYFLLGLIVEKVTGKPYETVVRKIIFDPLGMSQSGFDFINLPKQERAQGYEIWNEKEAIKYKHYDSTFAYSAGSAYSTTTDMLKWAKAVSSRQILEPHTWDLAFKPKIGRYGYGWMTGQFFGRNYVRHSGGYPGYMSEFIYYPSEGFTIVLLNNFGSYDNNLWSVAMGISCIVHQLPYDNWQLREKTRLDNSVLEKYVGYYKGPGKQKVVIKVKENSLYVEMEGLPDMVLHAESEQVFFLENFNDVLTFAKDKLTIHAHGKDYIYFRKDPGRGTNPE